ncbi:hypothetical protein D3C85_1659160 [compost metagenome]
MVGHRKIRVLISLKCCVALSAIKIISCQRTRLIIVIDNAAWSIGRTVRASKITITMAIAIIFVKRRSGNSYSISTVYQLKTLKT